VSDQEFTLCPFPDPGGLPAVALGGRLRRQGSRLAITFVLSGRLSEVVIPAAAARPGRRWLLWEGTCSEFFLALPGAQGYWEFNLSPAGHWNVFHLTGYRQGIAEEPAITDLPLTVRRQPDRLCLSLDLDLAALLPAAQPWLLAISAVLAHPDGRRTYWALVHPAAAPDFHHPASFILTLAAGPTRLSP